MTSPGVRLGPFVLERPLAQGGMGVVWRGSHPDSGLPVAVKAIMSDRAHAGAHDTAFRREVEAVAGLSHPAIVRVYDYGLIDADAAEASRALAPDRPLIAGSPFLAMELAQGGSLDRTWNPVGSWRWADLKSVLIQLLSGLAHAHARDVVHRDLKPGNVLVFGDRAAPRLKLADFGIAQALEGVEDGADDELAAAGTPLYMAPEQFLGRTREFGPWTDLYMLGCVAWELSTGMPPFVPELGSGARSAGTQDRRAARSALARSHLREAPPRLDALRPVSEGFEGWLLRLLQKSPELRFRRAADAARALEELPEPVHQELPSRVTPPRLGPPAGSETMDPGSLASQTLDPGTYLPGDEDEGLWLSGGRLVAEQSLGPVAPAPLSGPAPWTPWIREDGDGDGDGGAGGDRDGDGGAGGDGRGDRDGDGGGTERSELLGAGLGLYGLRSIPLVGRDGELETLWSALGEVLGTGTARAVVLKGALGAGKSRLAQVVGERAEELGLARSIAVRAGQQLAPGEALLRALERELRASGLPREATRGRVAAWADGLALRSSAPASSSPHLVDEITELLRPASERQREAAPGLPRVDSPSARQRVALRFIEALASERTLLLWIDDAQWAADTLALVRRLLLRPGGGPPVLVVLTVQNEAFRARPAEQEALATLTELGAVRVVDLEELPEHAHRDLVEGLLGLSGELAERVERRSAGNPLFAIQLVGDWVQRGVLEQRGGGFALRAGEQAVIPDDLYDIWARRVEALLGSLGPDAGPAAELAAALGDDVDDAEWRDASRNLGLGSEQALLNGLIERGLAIPTGRRWRYVHPLMRETLERRSREARRWAELNDACAAMLGRLPEGEKGVAARRGRHLVEAGRPAQALEPLLTGAKAYFATSEYDESEALLRLRAEQVAELGLPDSDPRVGWGELAALRTAFARRREPASLDAAAARVCSIAEASGDQLLAAEALRAHSVVALGARRLALGRRLALEALDRVGGIDPDVRTTGSTEVSAETWAQFVGSAATAMYVGGEFERCRDLALRGLAALEGRVGLRIQADLTQNLGRSLWNLGDVEAAVEHARRTIELYERNGSRYGAAAARNMLGEIRRESGRLHEAEELYRLASVQLDDLEAADRCFPQINLGVVLGAQGRDPEARAALEHGLHLAEADGNAFAAACCRCFLLRHVASLMDRDPWEAHLAGIRFHEDRKLPLLAELRPALALAVELCVAGGFPEDAAQLDRRIAALG